MKYDCLILDLDDTLFNYSVTEEEAVKYACEQQGIPFDSDVLLNYHKASEMAKVETTDYIINLHEFRKNRIMHFLSLINRNEVEIEKFIADYVGKSKQGVLLDGVAFTLRQLKDIKIIVATNGDSLRKDKLFNSEIAELIDGYYSSEDLGVAKPHSAFYKKILDDICIPMQKVLVVGDKYETDILSALGLGLSACWFNWKYRKAPIEMNCMMMHSFTELLNIIRI